MTPSSPIRNARSEPCLPWPRHILSQDEWSRMAAQPTPALLALWADTVQVHALLLDDVAQDILFASTDVVAGHYPALSPARPPAAWFERMVYDLWGHAASGGADQRPWLDHGHWPHAHPMALRVAPPGSAPEPPEFLPVAGEGLHQVPLGPVHGGIDAASHLRLTARGETIVRLEARLGYTHKGTLALMRGKSPRASARFAARLAGESTIAHSIAFARAAEAALATEPPGRAAALRAVMAEIERIAGHLGDLGAVAEAAGSAILSARCGRLRETLNRAAGIAFGHRLMMDCVVPGGVVADIAPGGAETVQRALLALAAELPELERLHDAGFLIERLSGCGTLPPGCAAGGPVGRAAGRGFDARRFRGIAPYDALDVVVPVLTEGDCHARACIRLAEIAESIRLLRALLDSLPAGGVSVPLPAESGEGIGCAEGCRGDIWHWLRLDHGQIASVFVRDPAWAHWPLLETVARGSPAADLPLIKASFGLTSSGVDL